MPQLKFTGGPWDGVEFEAGFAPDALNMANMQMYSGKDPGTGKLTIGVNEPTEHHVYLLMQDGEEHDSGICRYRYEKDGKPWWHGETQT